MSETVIVVPYDATYDRIESTDAGILFELNEALTFFAPNYRFHPAFKARRWSGKISLFQPFKKLLHVGLRQFLKEFCEKRGYTYEGGYTEPNPDFSEDDARAFIDTLGLPKELNGIPFEVRDYQLDAFVQAVRSGRTTLLSPTASGKSLIIYLLIRYFQKRTLIIVPTLGLVSQMKGDFEEYGMDPDLVHQIFSGQDRDTDHPYTVSTWQSLRKMSGGYLERFEVLIVDEVHGAKAKELRELVERMTTTHVRIGTSGTLDDNELNHLTIQGLFGPIYQVTTTKELIDSGRLASFNIKCLVLDYPQEVRKSLVKAEYQNEMKFLVTSEARNRFLVNLCRNLKGNTLLLYQFVSAHGEPLRDMMLEAVDWPVLFVSGGVPSEDREEIRKLANSSEQSTIIASKGTFSTGTNIPNIDNIIFASPSKARIQTLQSIGRGLRKSARKKAAVLYDVADDLGHKSWVNHTLNHFHERVRIYNKEQFEYTLHHVKF